MQRLIFWWGLWPTRWQSTCMEGIYQCRVVPTNMWAKITYKNLMLQAWKLFVWLALLVLGGGSRCYPNVRAKFRSQYLSQMMPYLGVVCPLWQGDGCAQLDQRHLEEKKVFTCCLLHDKRGSPQMTSCDPPNLRLMNFISNELQVHLLKNPNFLGKLTCHPHEILWKIFQLSKICGMTEMVMKQK